MSVGASGTTLTPDYDRFKAAVMKLGVSLNDFSDGRRKIAYLNYAALFDKSAPPYPASSNPRP